MQSDRGFVSGFIGVGIHMRIQHILQHIHIASRCQEELGNLKDLVMRIELIIMHIQQNRLAFKSNKDKGEASAVNEWLEKLDGDLLLKSTKMVQRCSRPKSRVNFSCCEPRKEIDRLIKDITEHLKLSPLLVRIPEHQAGDTQMVIEGHQAGGTQKVIEGLGQIRDSVETLASCATTSQVARTNLLVGQNDVLPNLKKLVIADADAKFIGVLGKAGSGKSLILRTLYNSQEVRTHFSDGLLLWLTLSGRPSAKSLMDDLCKQIAIQKVLDLNKDIRPGEENIWLKQKLQQSRGFVLFLDEVWGEIAAELLKGLGILDAVRDHSKSKIIASSRDLTSLLTMEDEYKWRKTKIEDLMDLRGRMNLIEEPYMVGQEKAFADEPYMVGQKNVFEDLKNFLVADGDPKFIGVLGKCGSGKTLLLKTLFNNQEVRNHFRDGLLLRLSLLQRPSVEGLMNALCKQIAIQKKIDLIEAIKEEEEINWLRQQLHHPSRRFMLVLDDALSGRNAAELLEILGIRNESGRSNYKVIVSSRDEGELQRLGVADEHTKTIEDLTENERWQLFEHHAFPLLPHLDEDDPQANVNEENAIRQKARLLCNKCEGVPLGIKVVGKAMARGAHPKHWIKWALDRLENGHSLKDCLRLSYDALGKEDFNMQLCFLLVAAAFLQDEIIDVQEVIPLWMGEGLLARKMLQNVPPHILADHFLIEPMIRNTKESLVCLRLQNPFEIGRLYVDLLAERSLIEPILKDADGLVVCFRMRDVLRDLATQIATREEYFSCFLGNDGAFQETLEGKRIFLGGKKLSSLPQFTPSSSSQMCSLLISQNTQLPKIPKGVIGSLLSLKVLDLSGTSARSLPENVGYLKQLVFLKLFRMPIKTLPKSLTELLHLEILDVSFTKIKELPSDIHMLRSLRYLGLRGCKYLQNLPSSISGLLSLQYLYMDGCSMWTTNPACNRLKKVASLKSLGDLIQLKKLALQNNSEAFSEGTLGSMTELDSLLLILPKMESLPHDISNMSKLRRLSFRCSKLTKMDPFICSSLTETETEMKNDVTNLKYLSYLKFYECSMLEEFQHLHKLQNLRQLEIILCLEVKKIPKQFGEKGAFPLLKIFSLVGLRNLEELPEREEGAMPSLEILTIMDCPKLRTLPQTYSNLQTKVRVYDHPQVMADRGNMDGVQVVTISMNAEEIIKKYLQTFGKEEDWLYGEFWCNELFLFWEGLTMYTHHI